MNSMAFKKVMKSFKLIQEQIKSLQKDYNKIIQQSENSFKNENK